MPRVERNTRPAPQKPTSTAPTTKAAAKKPAANAKPASATNATARSSAALTGDDGFTSNLNPRPISATGYKSTFASHYDWASTDFGSNIGVGGPHLPKIAEAGKPLMIEYSRGLLDIGLQGTLEKAELFYRIDGGPVQSVTVAEGESARAPGLRTPTRLDIPANAKGEVEYWFKLTTTDGQSHWDSNFGNNFRTNIVPAGGSTLRFDDLWGETLSGPIKAGSTLRLAYDVDRIKPFLRGTSHHGYETWNVVAFVSFDGKAPQEVPLTAMQYGQYGTVAKVVPVEAAIEVPTDAKSVSVWIQGRAYAGGAYDSNFGTNYTYPVEP